MHSVRNLSPTWGRQVRFQDRTTRKKLWLHCKVLLDSRRTHLVKRITSRVLQRVLIGSSCERGFHRLISITRPSRITNSALFPLPRRFTLPYWPSSQWYSTVTF